MAFNIFVGSETGLLKGVSLANNTWRNVKSLETADKEQGIITSCWGNERQSEVCIGLRNQQVQVFDTLREDIVHTYNFSAGTSSLTGLAKCEEKYVTCTESGALRLWESDGQRSNLEIDVGVDINCMKQNPEKINTIATGGKENDLKVWDLETGATVPIFSAKNVRNDWLDLRVPVWVTDIAFTPQSHTLVTCTRHNHVRVYDPRTSQRRPVKEMKHLDHPLLSLALRPGHSDQVLVGSAQGHLSLLDLRGKPYQVQAYKGFAGAITSVQCHPTADLIATCGLDRFLRVHDIDSRELVHKFYLKSRLTCLLFSSSNPHATAEKKTSKSQRKVAPLDAAADLVADDDSGSEDNDVWANMEVVESKKRKSEVSAEGENGLKHTKKRKEKVKKLKKGEESEKTSITAKKARSKEQKKNKKKAEGIDE